MNSLSHPDRPSNPQISVQMAGDEGVADERLAFYLTRKKRAGSGLVKQYESGGETLPKVGDFWMIPNGDQGPKCVVRTTRVQ